MRILLIGEYSGVHSELKKALLELGHHVTLISDGDSYKNFNSDIEIKNYRKFNKNIFKSIIYLFYDFSGFAGLKTFLKFWKKIKIEISGYDVVQLINPVAFSGFGSIPNLILLRYLKKKKNKIYLCALGDDYYWVKSCFKRENKFEALKHINFLNFYLHSFSTKYTHGILYKYLNNYAIKISIKIIPGAYDFHKVYSWSLKCSNIIPLPIAYDKIGSPLKINPNEKIIIFHGWQKGKENRKGNYIFDRVVKKLLLKYPSKINYKVVSNISYDKYVKTIKLAHIALDQCFSYDKGMNGLINMAAGKVTFTGLEPEALENYELKTFNQIGINAKNDEKYLFKELEYLILNPSKIEEISIAAIDFVKLNHTSEKIAKRYLDIWSSSEM
jgi:hypothetical protein